ncbi:MAG: hypothetical protein ACYSU0_11395 [Planctomycetota bacterium]|jgi:hypothetical protein
MPGASGYQEVDGRIRVEQTWPEEPMRGSGARITLYTPYFVSLSAAASRLHGASIAGLVVGAMGVFVFSAAYRHWLGERRRFREEARPSASVDRPPSAS